MEDADCNVIYVDRSVVKDRCVRAGEQNSDRDTAEKEGAHVAEHVNLLLDVFGEVHLCSSGGACLTQWLDLIETSVVTVKPTLFLLDTPYQDPIPERSLSRPTSSYSLTDDSAGGGQDEEIYGLGLLRRIISESHVRNVSKLVVTIPIISWPNESDPSGNDDLTAIPDRKAASKRMLKQCLDLGATDVMTKPMNAKCVTNLEVHAYRAHLDASREQQAFVALRRGRKRSWIGAYDEKPFSYLREAMVSKLLDRICRIECEIEDVPASIGLSVSAERQAAIASAVSQWDFNAHDFNEDELVAAAIAMFKHALSMPELAEWRIPRDQLHRFLLACRGAYIDFVPYHNFRHVVDVLQATFHFLVSIGSLPPYPSASRLPDATDPKPPIVKLLRPLEALTLLITAIGHDVGHPGVNNGFLITMNAPLAQMYNDRSVLESFHCAAFSQILRRYWPSVFENPRIRSLMISSILATDMSLHFKYMKKLSDLKAKLADNSNTEAWAESLKNEQIANACALLIKCADISNVTRQHDVAEKWMNILSEEFFRQSSMEQVLAIKTSLMSEPKKDMLSLTTAQLGFMDLFAIPLFQGVADVLPAMQYCVDQLILNKKSFTALQEQAKQSASTDNPASLRVGESELCSTIAFTTFPQPPTEAHPAKEACADEHIHQVVEPQLAAEPVAVEQHEPFQMPHRTSKRTADERMVNGIVTAFPPAPDFSHVEPFHDDNSHVPGHTRQRRSETTDGGSAPNSGDWASQATSATTGKMPLSPSTQGTSIVSRDSFEHPSSVPTTNRPPASESTTTVPESASKSQAEFKIDSCPPLVLDEEHADFWRSGQVTNGAGRKTTCLLEPDPANNNNNGNNCNGRQLKKKPSRFRINGLQNLFRKHKSSSPPMQAADTAG